MAKEYKYFVWIADTNNYQNSKRITVILDHPIDDPDLETIEKNNFLSLYSNNVVTNYKLLNVTGTFTYQFVYQIIDRFSSEPKLESTIVTLNHQINTSIIEADYEDLTDQIVEENPGCEIVVLFHVEIQD